MFTKEQIRELEIMWWLARYPRGYVKHTPTAILFYTGENRESETDDG